MMRKRLAQERGHADHGWLEARHSFSFAGYHDPAHMGFRTLRVLNDDRVQPGQGFGTHGHKDMEIITYVLDGALEHKDSLGTGSVLRPGDVQRMSAGRGVTHSEFNHSQDDVLRLLQIWILPEKEGLEPGYEEKNFSAEDKQGRLRLIAAPGGPDGALDVHQDVRVYAGILAAGDSVRHEMAPGRHVWLQVARGRVQVQGMELNEGDGLAVSEEPVLDIEGVDGGEVLLFDLN
jgi:redox-sensitive bicupin YhaK (pirin superfamily)|nr:pirin family protein [Candidatus Krumholzibacteria bacterium]